MHVTARQIATTLKWSLEDSGMQIFQQKCEKYNLLWQNKTWLDKEMLIIQRIWLAQWAKHIFLNVIIYTIFMNPSHTRTHYPLSPCACIISKAFKIDAAPVSINLIISIISWPLCNRLQLTNRFTFHCTSGSNISCTGGIITNHIVRYKLWSKCATVTGINCLLHCQCMDSFTVFSVVAV